MASSDRSSWYTIEAGRRHVTPYWHAFTSFAKGRWVGRTVLDVLSEEFPHIDEAYLVENAGAGRLTLNGHPATGRVVYL